MIHVYNASLQTDLLCTSLYYSSQLDEFEHIRSWKVETIGKAHHILSMRLSLCQKCHTTAVISYNIVIKNTSPFLNPPSVFQRDDNEYIEITSEQYSTTSIRTPTPLTLLHNRNIQPPPIQCYHTNFKQLSCQYIPTSIHENNCPCSID